MKLADFISESLTAIMNGVQASQAAAANMGAKVNPTGLSFKKEEHWHHDSSSMVQTIEFDIAVTTAQGTETKGGIGVMVGGIGLGSHGKSDKSTESLSRIKFCVPILLPQQQ
jgi:hypothetical protein